MTTTNDKIVKIQYGSFSLSIEGYDKPYKMLKKVTELYSLISKTNPSFGSTPVNAVYKAPDGTSQPKTKVSAPDSKNIWNDEQNSILVLADPEPDYSRTDPTQIRASAQPLSAVELADDPSTDSAGFAPTPIDNAPKYQAPKYPFRRFPSKNT